MYSELYPYIDTMFDNIYCISDAITDVNASEIYFKATVIVLFSIVFFNVI